MTPVAIIGLAGIFPDAPNVATLWANILKKRSAIREVPESRWRLADYYDPNPSAPDKTYSRVGGFMPDVEFDPVEFGIPPNVLEVTDVAQLLGLLIARDALADAGYVEGSEKPFPRERTGVILGIGGGQKLITPLTSRLQTPIWEEAMRSSGLSDEDARAISEKAKLAYAPWEENSFPGLLGNVIAGRIANRFDLGGINCVVDAACASSLAALQMAVSQLSEKQCDVMLTGGIDTDNTPFMYLCFSKTPAFSRQGAIRPFDAESDGMLIGEVAGMLVLKRLEDAERDGDRIYAVVRGIGSSSDGRFSSIYAPRSEGQARALERAYQQANVPLHTIGLIEAHGTGTAAGDLVEIGTLNRVFGHDVADQIALGSIKSQIGHGKAAAGAVGLIKAALALHHKVLPPTINVTQPHPAGHFGDSAFYINAEARPWIRPAEETPRRAGVSSFGFGGSNYHAVLEEHGSEQRGPYRLQPHARSFFFSGPTSTEVAVEVSRAANWLASEPEAFEALVAESADRRANEEDARLGFAAETADEALALLRIAGERLARESSPPGWDDPKGVFFRPAGMAWEGRIAALFPGQGSQYVGMGTDLALNFPEIREMLAALDRLFQNEEKRLSDVVYPPARFGADEAAADAALLQSTEMAQPAIGALSAGMFRILERSGFKPDFLAGHSFGELTALWAAGSLTDEAFCRLARARGKAMAPPDSSGFDPGSMLAVQASEADLAPLLADMEGVTLANINGPSQVVLGGSTAAIERAEAILTDRRLSVSRLPVAAAFHTALVAHASDALSAAVAEVRIKAPARPVYANATAQRYPKKAADVARLLVDQVLSPVRFADEIEQLYEAGARIFVEIGPRGVLTSLVNDILGARPHETVALNPSRQRGADRQLREALTKLRVLGLPLSLADRYDCTSSARHRQKSSATVTINGANYVSPARREAYRRALDSGHRLQIAAPDQPSSAGGARRADVNPADIDKPTTEAQLTGDPAVMAGTGRSTVSEIARLQAAILDLHQTFLRDQSEQNRVLLGLLQQQRDPGFAGLPTAAREEAQESLRAFQALQAGTLESHARFLEQQTAWLKALAGQPGQLQPERTAAVETAAISGNAMPPAAPPDSAPSAAFWPTAALPAAPPIAAESSAPAPVDATPAAAPDVEEVRRALLELVSERTGYPLDVLDLEMDIEADLGIDSIKRVEILGALRARFPDAPQPQPAELGELRTLAQVVSYLAGPAIPAGAPPQPAQTPAEVANARPVTSLAGAVDGPEWPAEAISDALLALVSERTGYPRDVLDLDMDIEADLGIDSIKRVEILGALRDRFPEMPQPGPAELGELRTLARVVEYLTGSSVDGHFPSGSEQPVHETPAAGIDQPRTPATGVRLKHLPPPDRLDGAIPREAPCLVTDDGSPRTAAMVDALKQAGARVKTLQLPASLVPFPSTTNGTECVRIDAIDEAAIGTVCRGAAGLIFLHPTRAGDEGLFSDREHECMRLAFALAKHMAEPLQQAATRPDGRPFFCAVTSLDGALGLDRPSGGTGVASSGLLGLVKTLRLEWPGVHCRAVDVAPDVDAQTAAAQVLSELLDPAATPAEVAVGKGGRLTAVPAVEAP